ncbi:hypothetical protein [Streptosporangium sp. V21-05]|uniref:hypothetical protein n=1 Tax=Streptosporangium sp. V21-05 TaxID=3446115 RepID=UPI003F5316C7
MARIITQLIDEREIPKYLSGVADIEAEGELDEIDTDSGGWVGAADDGIAINEMDSERCLIKYELWDGPPLPPIRDTWDRTWSGSVRLTSGKVHAVNEHSGDTFYGAEFDLGEKNRVWRVKIHRSFLGHQSLAPDLVGITLINIQFWPDR